MNSAPTGVWTTGDINAGGAGVMSFTGGAWCYTTGALIAITPSIAQSQGAWYSSIVFGIESGAVGSTLSIAEVN